MLEERRMEGEEKDRDEEEEVEEEVSSINIRRQ